MEGVGIIVPRTIYRQIPNLNGNHKTMFMLFERAAARNNLIPCFIRLRHLHPDKKSVVAYVLTSEGYKLMRIPRPKVNYSRILDRHPVIRKRIYDLYRAGVTIFNVPNYDIEKFTIHQLLNRDKNIQKYLPHTELLTEQSFIKMLSLYKSVILKKNYGERGIGAMKIDKGIKHCTLTYKPLNSHVFEKVNFTAEIPSVVLEHIEKKDYVIQERIPLATFKGNPFDMRVALQKDGTGMFKVTGIMCKVAKDKSFLTNGSQGGKTCRLEDICPISFPSMSYEKLKRDICTMSLMIANKLDKHFPHLADLGFDICLTNKGAPYFIECNFISDYVGGLIHQQRLLQEEWESVFSTPIDYARYLLDQKNISI
ncbi:YheC/YheD family protein [Bacillus sp. J37]|uniref:YheC/YheD family protein n=1 Tax=Bacillus sp. J37 TaxID=935837 RepID=UPI00047B0278|nr:YheC/YheD family protein [Bacillus sp. J37]